MDQGLCTADKWVLHRFHRKIEMGDYDGCIVDIVVIVEEGKFQVVVDDHRFEFHVMRLIGKMNTLIWLLLFFGFNTTGLRLILFG